MSTPPLTWSESVRYCGMCLNSPNAVNLHKKAKKGRRLTQAEISAIEKYASSFASIVGTDQTVIDFPSPRFPKYGIKVPSELVLNGDSAVLFVRGKWLVDTVTERCVGRWDDGGELLTVFPNPVVLVTDAARLVSESSL